MAKASGVSGVEIRSDHFAWNALLRQSVHDGSCDVLHREGNSMGGPRDLIALG